MTPNPPPPAPRLRRAARVAAAWTLPALALGVGACSALLKAPSVTIADVRVSGIGLSGASADIVLEVTNPNPFTLTSSGLSYRLDFEDPYGAAGSGSSGASGGEGAGEAGGTDGDGTAWRRIAGGRTTTEVRLGGRDTTAVTVEVPFEYEDLGRALMALLGRGELDYRLTGDVLFDAPLGTIRVPFEDTGRVGL